MREVIDACRRITGHPIPAVTAPRRPGDPPELSPTPAWPASCSAGRRSYTTIESIVETAWRWHQSHPRGTE